jgi:hypothetical protein
MKEEGKGERERKKVTCDGGIGGYSLELYHKRCQCRASFEYIYLCT